MVFVTLHHTQLAIPVGSEDSARSFYVGVLGLTEVSKPPTLAARGGLWLRAGGVEIHLGVEDPFTPARKAHPGILVEDLQEMRRRVAASGQRPEIDETFPGYLRIYVNDPFGNRIELLEVERRG